jgi:hypothetical protein
MWRLCHWSEEILVGTQHRNETTQLDSLEMHAISSYTRTAKQGGQLSAVHGNVPGTFQRGSWKSIL